MPTTVLFLQHPDLVLILGPSATKWPERLGFQGTDAIS